VLWWVFDFLWNSIGWYLVELVKIAWLRLVDAGIANPTSGGQIRRSLSEDQWFTKPLGVGLALLLIYAVGLLVGNFLGRAFYLAAERLLLRVPVIKLVYPTFKQITEFVLADKERQFEGSRVVAVRPHSRGIWSIALVTGHGLPPLSEASRDQTVTVFVPSSPAAFSGYVMVAPRSEVVELPMTVEEAMRLLVSGGVVAPGGKRAGSEIRIPPAGSPAPDGSTNGEPDGVTRSPATPPSPAVSPGPVAR